MRTILRGLSTMKYSEIGKAMERHQKITHTDTVADRMSFEIPEKRTSVLIHISRVLDEYDLKVGQTAQKSNGRIVFSVVEQ